MRRCVSRFAFTLLTVAAFVSIAVALAREETVARAGVEPTDPDRSGRGSEPATRTRRGVARVPFGFRLPEERARPARRERRFASPRLLENELPAAIDLAAGAAGHLLQRQRRRRIRPGQRRVGADVARPGAGVRVLHAERASVGRSHIRAARCRVRVLSPSRQSRRRRARRRVRDPGCARLPFFTGSFFGTTDQRTPFDQRWGGWYVTGTHGSQTHMGNTVAADPERPTDLDQSANGNVTTLAGRFDAANYLASTSDIVALMTLEHQAGVTNRILGLSRQYERNQRSWGSDSLARAVDDGIDDLVGHMLFVDEAPLREPVAGVSTFTQTFPNRGPRDGRGRSLRDFDLRTRLFRYRLSYMIYSEAFDGMPARLLERVYRRLYDVAGGERFARQVCGSVSRRSSHHARDHSRDKGEAAGLLAAINQRQLNPAFYTSSESRKPAGLAPRR